MAGFQQTGVLVQLTGFVVRSSDLHMVFPPLQKGRSNGISSPSKKLCEGGFEDARARGFSINFGAALYGML